MVSGNQTVRGWELKVIGPTCPTEDLKGESNRITKCEAIISAQHWGGGGVNLYLQLFCLNKFFFFFSQSLKNRVQRLKPSLRLIIVSIDPGLSCPTTVCIHTWISWHGSAALVFEVLGSGDNYHSKRKWKHPWRLPRDAVCTPCLLVSAISCQLCSRPSLSLRHSPAREKMAA